MNKQIDRDREREPGRPSGALAPRLTPTLGRRGSLDSARCVCVSAPDRSMDAFSS